MKYHHCSIYIIGQSFNPNFFRLQMTDQNDNIYIIAHAIFIELVFTHYLHVPSCHREKTDSYLSP